MPTFINEEIQIGEITFNINGFINQDHYGVVDLDDSVVHIEEVIAIIPTEDGIQEIEGNAIIESLYGWPQFKNLVLETIEN
jgi:hypothetical protein